MKLDNSSITPLYIQLKDKIKEDIQQGKYKVGQQLPPESEICEVYGVSRITSRRAILDLVEEGILQRQQGKGTFVTEKKIKRELIDVNGFYDFTTSSGKAARAHILSSTTEAADEHQASLLRIQQGDPILRLERLYFIDDHPFSRESAHYPLNRFPGMEQHIQEGSSVYRLLKERYQTEAYHNEKTVNVIVANTEQADLLKCTVGTPIFEIEKVVLDEQEVPIHLSVSHYPTTRVTFTLKASKSESRP
ncbi:GntR family transcriptional regulator [Ammoniphilus sp. YIM 78166]|uniref:GntR family transcriptional regulator n=1 Tax=Ammoniphilus sp. YIM 78166 TaxID=1644106 RepID=UPI00106FB2E8|nr:GntR family transcriptional regulator [Ammoniphilus sp. YIM 78166]